MNLGFLVRRCEFAEPKPYSGKGEVEFAVVACLLWFIAIVVRLGFSERPWTWTEKLFEATSFIVFAAIPVLFLATPHGTNFANNHLLKKDGLKFQLIACLLFVIYGAAATLLGVSPDRFVWLTQLHTLIIKDSSWLNFSLFIVGTFVILRIPFLLLRLRDRQTQFKNFQDLLTMIQQNRELSLLLMINLIYTSLVNTSLISSQLKSDNSGYYIGFSYFVIFLLMNLPAVKQKPGKQSTIFNFLLTIACAGSLFWFSRPFFSFGVFVSLTLFIVVVIFGTGLGREHFGYSFQLRRYDLSYVLKAICIATLVLVPAAIVLKFSSSASDQSLFTTNNSLQYLAFLLSYAILFSFRVGMFEEIFFRCGLMVFMRDQLSEQTTDMIARHQRVKRVVLPAIGCSLIFGLCHIGNDPGSGISLSPYLYKAIYAALAIVASLFYSLAFGETNRLWCSIVIHGFVDTTAVVLLGASLTVPF